MIRAAQHRSSTIQSIMKSCLRLILVLALGSGPAMAQTTLGPTAYLSYGDSPFAALSVNGYFHFEDFEDGFFNVPGVVADNGAVYGPAGLADSVDGDDGSIDGLGQSGRTFFNTSGSVTFTFNSVTLGTLPTHVGLVWTDGGNPTFTAYDVGNNLLGTVSGATADGSNSGTTAEDRFYGFIYAGGIASITMSAGTWEVDHLQYGTLAAVPEPAAWAGLLGGMALAVVALRRRRSP